jgi:hypothetical protein
MGLLELLQWKERFYFEERRSFKWQILYIQYFMRIQHKRHYIILFYYITFNEALTIAALRVLWWCLYPKISSLP